MRMQMQMLVQMQLQVLIQMLIQMHTRTLTLQVIALTDMPAMDALPWKIIIDEHRRPDNGAAIVDLGLGNDLMLKNDFFRVRIGKLESNREVQLFDSQLRFLPATGPNSSGELDSSPYAKGSPYEDEAEEVWMYVNC